MTPPKQAPATALELAAMVDSLSPVALKNALYDYLTWQAAHGHRPGHIAQYVKSAYYKQRPRDSTIRKQMASMQELTAGIGKTG